MKIAGKIIVIEEIKEGKNDKGSWKNRTILLQISEGTSIAVVFWGELADKDFVLNDEIVVQVNISSKSYNGRYYTDITALKFE